MSTIYSTNAQLTRIKGLVQNLKSSGIKVPQALTDEIKLLNSLQLVKDKRQAERQSRMNDLANVSADKFEAVLARAENLWASEPLDDFTSQVESIHQRRVFTALFQASAELHSDIADKINEIVDTYRLNEVSLPQDLANFNIMRSTPQDLEAITAFRSAVPSLQVLWGSYKSIATELGHDLSGKEFSSALDLVFMLTDVDNFYSAQVLANRFEVLRMGVDSMRNIQELGLWGIINLSGHRIEMRSIADAQFRRGEVQNPALVTPEAANRAAGFLLQ